MELFTLKQLILYDVHFASLKLLLLFLKESISAFHRMKFKFLNPSFRLDSPLLGPADLVNLLPTFVTFLFSLMSPLYFLLPPRQLCHSTGL